VDIAEGTSDDLDGNGVADECDPDRDDWRAWKDRPDTSFFSSVHRHDRIVELRYTVPPGGARVRLVVRDRAGASVKRLVDAKQPGDAYIVQWDRRAWHGALAPPGTYEVRLDVGKRTYSRRLRWDR